MTNHTTKEKATAQCGVKRRSILRHVAACGGSVIGLTLSQSATAQSTTAQTEFTQTYGGSGQDRTRSVVQTRDGGYALAGHTRSFGAADKDFWLVKTDVQGNEQFNRTYGGNSNDKARAVVQTRDGGYALVGWTRSYGSGTNGWLVKTDAQGNEQFTQTYGGDDRDVARSIVETRDGGYAFVGRTRSSGSGHDDFWLVKTDAQGNEQFSKTYGGTGRDVAASVAQTRDGGYAIAGPSRSFGAEYFNFWLVKTDAQGNEQFTQTYGGDDRDSAQSVIQTRDGGYALAGATESFGAGNNDFWLVKTDGEGNVQFTQAYGGSADEGAGSLVQTRDGGYALTGSTKSFGTEGSADAWLVKTQRET